LKVVELVGLGPGPFAGQLLADLGADVVAVERPAVAARADRSKPSTAIFSRGKRSIALDLKSPDDVSTLLALLDGADAFIDPFRPGVCERLGVGPEVVCQRNPRMIYGRMTGWGQDGPLADRAGHDINYISLSGALHAMGYEGQPPTMPLNLLGDFAGGGMLLAMGIACAAFERSTSGKGQVIDAAMVDGATLLFIPIFGMAVNGMWGDRGTNFLDGGAHFYNVYETADGKWVSVGAIEPQFYAELLKGLGFDDDGRQNDKAVWPQWKARFAEVFKTKTRAEWDDVFDGTDACFAPVLHASEVATYPHTAARDIVVEINGAPQPQIAPRFSRTPGAAKEPCHPGEHDATEIVAEWKAGS
jgi:alpha-methylacyl-CoA racemase